MVLEATPVSQLRVLLHASIVDLGDQDPFVLKCNRNKLPLNRVFRQVSRLSSFSAFLLQSFSRSSGLGNTSGRY